MRYYVVADVHGFYDELIATLKEKGYFDDSNPHKLIVCGDLLDRGKQALKLQEFILDLMSKDEVILVRGNHEDLFYRFINQDDCLPYNVHVYNGTYDTALQLSKMTMMDAYSDTSTFKEKLIETPYYKKIIPSMIDYFEAGDYIFVHGYIPVFGEPFSFSYNENWKEASKYEWEEARWANGMEVNRQVKVPGKTIVCGHFHTSFGHSIYEGKGSEFGEDADFSPFYAEGLIAIDACTAASKIINCLVLDID